MKLIANPARLEMVPFLVLLIFVGCARAPRFRPHPIVSSAPAAPALASSAPTLPVPPPPLSDHPPLLLGETVHYTFLWFGLEVMRGELHVAGAPALQNGRPLVALSAVVRSTGVIQHLFSVEDRLTALVDPQTVLPARFEFALRHRAHRVEETITFDRTRRLAHSTRYPGPLAVPPDARDLLSTYYFLRTLHPLAEGTVLTDDFVAQGRSWPLTARLRRRGELTLASGTVPVWEVEVTTPWLKPFLKHDTLWMWISDDAARVPLMVRIKFPLGWVTALRDDR